MAKTDLKACESTQPNGGVVGGDRGAASSYRERQGQAAERELLDVRLGDGAASVYLVAGIILWARVQS